MLVIILAEAETAIGNKTQATIFKWELSLEQLQKLNDFANQLAEEQE